MQCCMATVKDNLEKTELKTKEITVLARKQGVKVLLVEQACSFYQVLSIQQMPLL